MSQHIRVIFLEKNENIPEELKMVIELPDGQTVNYKVPTIKFGEYDIIELFERDLYILLPLYVIKLRREFENLKKKSKKTKEEKSKLNKIKFEYLLEVITNILKILSELLISEKITLEDYNLMTTAMSNLSEYLYNKYESYEDVDKEVRDMVKTFIDPKVKAEGKVEGKAEDIVELLEEKGDIGIDLLNRIEQEMNIDILRKWLKLAAKAVSVEEFELRMDC